MSDMVANKELNKTGFLKFESLWDDGGTCTLFIDRTGAQELPAFIWCNTDGWDHVFASYSDRYFTADETELVKRFFCSRQNRHQAAAQRGVSRQREAGLLAYG